MKATLTTLTPVHIGNGTTYNRNIDFIQSGNKIGIIDEKKVFKLLGEENLHQWVAAIDRGGNAFVELLKSRGWVEDDLDTVCSRIDNLKSSKHNSTQLKEIYRTPLKGITIPGSSIKGALRTLIFNDLLTEDVMGNIKLKDLQNKYGKFDFTTLDKQIFGSNANEKSTRFLKVRDVHFENIKANVYEVQILDAFHKGWSFKPGQQTLVEAIPANCSAEFEIIVDELLLQRNIENETQERRKFQNDPRNTGKTYQTKWPEEKINYLKNGIEDLCWRVNEHTKFLAGTEYNNLLEEEIIDAGNILETYDHIYEMCETAGNREMILRVGGFSGYLFTTGQWMGMEKQINISDVEFNNLRKSVQKRDYTQMAIWPKTRKVTSGGRLFGFVRISF